MKIIVRKPFRAIGAFEVDNLPDFVVLTGENGTGKTQLLEYLYQTSTTQLKTGDLIPEPISDGPVNDIPEGEYITREDGVRVYMSPAELCIPDKPKANIAYRAVQAPNVDVGVKFDHKALYMEGESIAQKHLFYKSRPLGMEDVEDETELTIAFQKALGLKRGVKISTDTILPNISKTDLDVIRKIEAEYPSNEFSKDAYYFVAFQKVPQTNVFTANLKFLYFQYWARQKAGLPTAIAPWEAFNQMGEMLNFKFELDEPKIAENKFDVRLRDKDKKVFISTDTLSSGEKVIFSLFVAMYTARNSEHLPDVIMFDEPDAFLHPSLCRTMIDVMQKVFIGQHGIKVIITTHSPTTVALVPESSLYRMTNGIMQKSTKKDAILALTTGLNTISVYYENVKQIFVEAANDNRYYSFVTHYATQMQLLADDIQLKFVNVGDDKNGGCSIVKGVVNDLTTANNKTVYGIVDWDGNRTGNDRIFVLGEGKRYAIDNYIVDPLVLILLCAEQPSFREKIGLDKLDTQVSFSQKKPSEIQVLINKVIDVIKAHVPDEKMAEAEMMSYTIAGGDSYSIPKWFVHIKGHDLVDYVKNAFPFLHRYPTDKQLCNHVVNNIYAAYPTIIPMDVIETLRKIQQHE